MSSVLPQTPLPKMKIVAPKNLHSESNPVNNGHIYGVSELTQKIKAILEKTFPFIWISGEISNLRIPSSGHCYFTLRDDVAQIGAVMFRRQVNGLKFRMEDGLSIVGLGRISVYEPRGTYQIIFEHLEPKGAGLLQIAFEKLKRRLYEEGLFDEKHKRPLPDLPQTVVIVTSPTGAAVHDFINVAHRRYPNISIDVVPVRVQGDRSPDEIIRAIAIINRLANADLIVLARGGGSLEDLWAFNDEGVARAIHASQIPVVSAVGHETDFTIADFVADLRAPTPSAAAEIAIPLKEERIKRIENLKQRLYRFVDKDLYIKKIELSNFSVRLVHPRKRLQEMRLRLDDTVMGLESTMAGLLSRNRERLSYGQKALTALSPSRTIGVLRDRRISLQRLLVSHTNRAIKEKRAANATCFAMLDALNPLAILQRGYSITRTISDAAIVRNAKKVETGQHLEVLLGKGKLTVTVDQRDLDFETERSSN